MYCQGLVVMLKVFGVLLQEWPLKSAEYYTVSTPALFQLSLHYMSPGRISFFPLSVPVQHVKSLGSKFSNYLSTKHSLSLVELRLPTGPLAFCGTIYGFSKKL